MNQKETTAVFIAFIIHLILIIFIYDSKIINQKPHPTSTISIDDFVIQKQQSKPKRKTVFKPVKMVKKIDAKLIMPKPPKPKIIPIKKHSKPTKHPNPKPITTKKHLQPIVSKPKIKPTTKKNAKIIKPQSSLSSFFDKKHKQPSNKQNKRKKSFSLYKDDFATFSKSQQTFIKDNLHIIEAIIQQNVFYPQLAVIYNIGGTLAVEFELYPDGSISEIRLLKESGYEILDNGFKQTIEIAYKDFPSPAQTTTIRCYMYFINNSF